MLDIRDNVHSSSVEDATFVGRNHILNVDEGIFSTMEFKHF
jgi:hypothetical protein